MFNHVPLFNSFYPWFKHVHVIIHWYICINLSTMENIKLSPRISLNPIVFFLDWLKIELKNVTWTRLECFMISKSWNINCHGSNSIIKCCIFPLQGRHCWLTLWAKKNVHNYPKSKLPKFSQELNFSHCCPFFQGRCYNFFNVFSVHWQCLITIDWSSC